MFKGFLISYCCFIQPSILSPLFNCWVTVILFNNTIHGFACMYEYRRPITLMKSSAPNCIIDEFSNASCALRKRSSSLRYFPTYMQFTFIFAGAGRSNKLMILIAWRSTISRVALKQSN